MTGYDLQELDWIKEKLSNNRLFCTPKGERIAIWNKDTKGQICIVNGTKELSSWLNGYEYAMEKKV